MTKKPTSGFSCENRLVIGVLLLVFYGTGNGEVTGSANTNSFKISGQILDAETLRNRDSSIRTDNDNGAVLLTMLSEEYEVNLESNGTANNILYCEVEKKPKYRLGRGSLLTYMLRLKLCEMAENTTWFEEECVDRSFAINDYHSAIYIKFCNPTFYDTECNSDFVHEPATILYLWMIFHNVRRPLDVLFRNESDEEKSGNQSPIDEAHCIAINSYFDSILLRRENESVGYSSDNITAELESPFYNVQYSEWFLSFRPFCNPSACGVSRQDYNNSSFSAFQCLPSSCKAPTIIVIVIDAILAAFIVVANALVLAVAIRTTVMNNVPGYFKISLAIADLIVGLVVLPGSVYHHTTVSLQPLPFRMEGQSPLVTDYFDQIYLNVMGFFTVWSFSVSIYTMGAASIDRYLAVTKPFKYKQRKYLTKKRSIAVFVLVWCFGFAISIYPIFTENSYTTSALGLILSTGFLAIVVYAVTLGLPLLAMWIINLALLGHVCSDKKNRRSLSVSTARVSANNEQDNMKQTANMNRNLNGKLSNDAFETTIDNNNSKRPSRLEKSSKSRFNVPSRLSLFTSSMHAQFKRRFSQASTNSVQSRMSVERRLAKTLGVMVGAFTLAILPSIIILGIQPALTLFISPHHYPKTYSPSAMTAYTSLEYIASRLFLSNSFWNCIIYSVRNRHFRRAVIDVFICDEEQRRKRRNTIAMSNSTSRVRRDRNVTKVTCVDSTEMSG